MEVFILVMIVVVVAAVIGVVIYFSQAHEKQRTQQLGEFAESLHFTFSPSPNSQLLSHLDEFAMFKRGTRRTAWNVMQGETADERVAVFDYRYTIGSGKNQHTLKQTMAVFESRLLNLPHFELRPETFWDKIAEFFGRKEIDFEEYPEFSKKYLLLGDDSVRSLFTEPVIKHFEELRSAHVAGTRNVLVFSFAARRSKPAELKEFLRHAYAVYALLKKEGTEGTERAWRE